MSHHSVTFRYKSRLQHELPWRNSDAANQILKSGIAAKRIESGIHPDPWESSRALQEGLLQRFHGFFIVTEFYVGSREEEATDVALLSFF